MQEGNTYLKSEVGREGRPRRARVYQKATEGVGVAIDKIAKGGTATTAAAGPGPEGEETLKISTPEGDSAGLHRMCGRTRNRVGFRDYPRKAT